MLLALRSRHEVIITIACVGITSEAAMGTPHVSATSSYGFVFGRKYEGVARPFEKVAPRTIAVTSIPSKEKFGKINISIDLVPVGIRKRQAVGEPSVSIGVLAKGIRSEKGIGFPGISIDILARGIYEGAIGQPLLWSPVIAEGVLSEEAFGEVSLAVDPVMEDIRITRYEDNEMIVFLLAA